MFAAKKFFHSEEEMEENRGLRLIETPTLTMALRTPASLEDIPPLADNLLNDRALVVDLSQLSPEDRLRALDYLDGVAYTLAAEAVRAGTDIYMFAPEQVEIAKA